MPFCQTCKGHYFDAGRHRCPPNWRTWDEEIEEGPEDGRDVYAVDAKGAAEAYVRGRDDVRDGDGYVVSVRRAGSEVTERYRVTAELTMTYHSEAVEGPHAGPEATASLEVS
jgi:hypothetical protein